MRNFQKIIKYAAIAFGFYLAVMIIGIIVSVVLAITTGIYGVKVITEQSNVQEIDWSEKFEEFTELDIEVGVANLSIIAEGEEYRVETYDIPENAIIENRNGKLEIKDKSTIFRSGESRIIVYIPENTTLRKVDLELGAGNVGIDNLKAETANIECGAGQVTIRNTELANADIDAGVGKLEFSGTLKGKTEVNCGIGEVAIDLQGGSEIYTLDVEKGIGDISVNEESVSSKTVIGNGENKVSIEGGIGKISINM